MQKLLLRDQNFSRCIGRRYSLSLERESVNKGNFQYLFSGIGIGVGEGSSELDDSATDADGYGLSTVTGTQFLHNMFDVHFDGFF